MAYPFLDTPILIPTLGTLTLFDLILNFILPLIFLAYAIGLLLEKIGVFRSSQTTRYLIGIAMAGLLVFVGKLGYIGLILGLAGVLIFKLKDWPSRVIAFLIVGFIVSQIGFTLDPNVLISKVLLISFSVLALFVLFTDTRIWLKIVMIVLIFAAYFVLFSYLQIYLSAFGL